MLILDLCGKIILNNHHWASSCSLPFLVCCARYVHEDAIAHFLIKFTDLAIPLLVDLEKDAFEIREERGKTTPQEDEKEMLP